MSKKRRDAGCRCGSGKKYKKCCMIKPLSRLSQGTHFDWDDQAVASIGGIDAIRPSRQKLWNRQNWSNEG
ncbi:MAG: SEC-C domain-containing protein [Myxococcales bacterium]|nr:SEC-C domain-containing protein [Myxococcales bacterium]